MVYIDAVFANLDCVVSGVNRNRKHPDILKAGDAFAGMINDKQAPEYISGKKKRKINRILPPRYRYQVGPVRIEKYVYEGYGLGYAAEGFAITVPAPFISGAPGPDAPRRTRRKRRHYFEIAAADPDALIPSPISGEELTNKTFFIRFAVPGDVVSAEIVRERKGIAYGAAVDYLQASGMRIPAPCPVFGKCGGCQLQMISYQDECRLKREMIEEMAHRCDNDGLFPPLREKIRDLVCSPQRFRYRNHIQIKTNRDRQWGFFGPDRNRVVPLPDAGCLLIPEEMNEALSHIHREGLAPNENYRIRQNKRGDVFWKGKVDPDSDAGRKIKADQAFFYDEIDSIRFRIGMDNFFQINRFQIENWLSHVISLLRLAKDSRVLDLYCGVGLISLPVAKRCAHVFGIEINGMSIRDAERSAADNHITNVKFISADVVDGIMAVMSEKIDRIVVDPPRSGCDMRLLDGILQLSEDMGGGRLVYVSCNPVTFFRDARYLLRHGAHLEVIQPIDMFPLTYHVELVSAFVLP